MMSGLDEVLQDDIKMLFGSDFSFQSFTVVHSKRMHRQLNSYDCGLFVIWYMQNLGQEWELDANKYDSDKARKNLVIQLVMCCNNEVKEKILECSHRFSVIQTNEVEQHACAKLFEKKYHAQCRRSNHKSHGHRK
ncbi:uncharacterized protein LOC112099313 isoform X2 [Citrus clementina]|uniref:uncharacterized protein LOC112099313 isoform X2 n=1 Tax=Citrus clementina TaxID=85681 RepID=UPI000CED1792|nr:uncharacterized protein LOC112099313 isoform X2 [Citrus x clementina]